MLNISGNVVVACITLATVPFASLLFAERFSLLFKAIDGFCEFTRWISIVVDKSLKISIIALDVITVLIFIFICGPFSGRDEEDEIAFNPSPSLLGLIYLGILALGVTFMYVRYQFFARFYIQKYYISFN